MNLTPFLLFDGNCAEAMAFYQACLGGELTVTKVGDTPMKDQLPPGQHAKVAYAQLSTGSSRATARRHRASRSGLGEFDGDVGGLDGGDHEHARLQVEFVGRLAAEQ